MMEYVVDEWLAEWLSLGATDQNGKIAILYVEQFVQNKDALVFGLEEPHYTKIRRYAKELRADPLVYAPFRVLLGVVFLNSDKFRGVSPKDYPTLNEDLHQLIHQAGSNFNSDEYLIQLAVMARDKLLVTSDKKLIQHLANSPELRLEEAVSFVEGSK